MFFDEILCFCGIFALPLLQLRAKEGQKAPGAKYPGGQIRESEFSYSKCVVWFGNLTGRALDM